MTQSASLPLPPEPPEADPRQRADIQLKKLSLLGEMVSSIAHELSNPLAAIVTSAQIVLASGDSGDHDHHGPFPTPVAGTREDLELIVAQARRAGEIVSGLLAFARMDRRTEPRPVSLEDILQRVATLARHHLKLHEVVLDTTGVTGPQSVHYWVNGDSNHLQQLFLNLIINAQQAVSAHQKTGTVWISTSNPEDDVLEVCIEDDGPGIPPETRDRIFEAFYTTKSDGQGTGLGLSIVTGIAQSHGASIRVDDRPHSGVRFVISFPTVADPGEEHKPPVASLVVHAGPTSTPHNRRVLLVDDEPVILHSVGRFLSASGYDVKPVDSAQEALAALRSGTYDAIVSDLRMPELSGEDLFALVKVEFPEMASHILFTSGDMMRDATREFVEDSGCPYLHKPYELTDLVATLQEIICPAGSEDVA